MPFHFSLLHTYIWGRCICTSGNCQEMIRASWDFKRQDQFHSRSDLYPAGTPVFPPPTSNRCAMVSPVHGGSGRQSTELLQGNNSKPLVQISGLHLGQNQTKKERSSLETPTQWTATSSPSERMQRINCHFWTVLCISRRTEVWTLTFTRNLPHTNQYLLSDSHHSVEHKLSVIRTLHHQAEHLY